MESDKFLSYLTKLSTERRIPFNINPLNTSLSRQETSKTADTFKVSIPEQEFIAKFFHGWQKREVEIYQKYLSHNNLNTPAFIFGDENVLIIEFCKGFWEPEYYSEHTKNLLFNWIVNKYKYFKDNLKSKTVKFDEHIVWMLQNPLKNLKNYGEEINLESLFQKEKWILRKFESLKTKNFPTVLDHNDLENQNILFNGNDIRIIDWANAVNSIGVIDFAQFFKNFGQIGIYESDLLSQLKTLFNVSHIEELLVLFQIVKEVMVLNFWVEFDIGSNQVIQSVQNLHILTNNL